METTICIAPKITKRKYTRRNSQRSTKSISTGINEIEPVVHKPELINEMSQSTSTLVVAESPAGPMLLHSQQVGSDTNCVPKKITKRRYTRRSSCKTTENPFTLVNTPLPLSIKPKTVAKVPQSNGTLVAVNFPIEPVSQLAIANDTNCAPKKISKRRYTRRKTMDIPFSNIDGSTLNTNLATLPIHTLVAAKSPQPRAKPPVVIEPTSAPKKPKRRYTRRNSFPMIDRPKFTTNSVPVMTQPTNALVLAKSPIENVLPQPKPPAMNETNCVPKKITKRRYTRRNICSAVENPFVITDIAKPVLAIPIPITEMQQSHATLTVKSPNESQLLQLKSAVDTNCVPKKITKRRYTRRNSSRTVENPFTKIDAPPSIILTSSPLIVTPHPELVPPVEINRPTEIEEQQTEHENEMWYHKKAYSFLKSLKQDYKRFKYLFKYLLREEQEKERRNIQELDELKRIYNRMQVEATEIKRKRWCRYCELEASYLTSVGIQFYCSKECEQKQKNLLSAMEDSLKQHRE